MHSWLEISRSALQNNFRAFKSLSKDAIFAPVLKSNGYGHGLAQVYEAIAEEKPAWLCVAYTDEAEQLRQLGFKGHILLVAPNYEDEFAKLAELDADMLLTHQELLDSWIAAKDKPRAHIKFDTGLTRQGFMPDEAESLCEQLKGQKDKLVGICTHFANVEDVLEHEYADTQLARFEQACGTFAKHGFELIRHSASSASDLILAKSRLDMCRIGISLYGFWPSPSTRLSFLQLNTDVIELKPALTWKTSIAMLKEVKAGAFIGYGCTYRAVKDMRVAVLPMGYNEGFPRLVGDDQSYVLIRGNRCPLVGRISMNLMVVDVSHVGDVQRYDEVILIGKSGAEEIDASRLAGWAKTIHYELVTCINQNLPRKLVP